jgi:hypothetical protein
LSSKGCKKNPTPEKNPLFNLLTPTTPFFIKARAKKNHPHKRIPEACFTSKMLSFQPTKDRAVHGTPLAGQWAAQTGKWGTRIKRKGVN